MTRLPDVDEVQITLGSGKVLDFKKSGGDKILVERVTTQVKATKVPVEYYKLIIVPEEDVPNEYKAD